MENIRWLFFDLGSTLIHEENAHRHRIISTADNNCDVTAEDIYKEMIQASRAFHQPYPTAVKNLKIVNKMPYPKELETPYAECKTVLKALHSKYSIGIIANQSEGSEKRLQKWGLLEYIDAVFASAEVGLSKPDPEFFKYALKKTAVSPADSVMIGDRLDNDILPAKKLAMKTIWIKQGFGAYQNVISEDYAPDFVIRNLNELIGLLV